MRTAIDISGKKYGKLTVACRCGSRNGNATWKCICACGRAILVDGSQLRCGKSTQCNHCKTTTHGLSKSGAYATWRCMIGRCLNPNNSEFHRYGGRGIAVCDSWRNFEAFYLDMGERPEGMSIERLNNELGYSKDNCVWATPKQQAMNRRPRITTNSHYN